MARLSHRIEKLEAMTDMSGKHLVIPPHSYYHGTIKNCTCRPYFTNIPFVIIPSLSDYYAQGDKYIPAPSDAEFIDDLGARV
jgi:hypothetical protein